MENSEKRWACIEDGLVDMVVIWDGVTEWPPAEDYVMVELPDDSPVGPGWDYDGKKFADNRPVEVDDETV